MAEYKSPGNLLPFLNPSEKCTLILVGDFNPFEKYSSNWIISLGFGVKIEIFELPSPSRGSSGKTIHFQALDTLKFLKGSKNTLPETNIWMVGRRSGFLFGASWAYFQKFWLVSGRVSRWKLRGSHNVRPNSPKKKYSSWNQKKNEF